MSSIPPYTSYAWRGYDVMPGYVKNKNWWMDIPSGKHGSDWQGSIDNVFPLRVRDHSRHPIAGDKLYSPDARNPARELKGSHIEGSIFDAAKSYFLDNQEPITEVIPAHNFLYNDGSVESFKTNFLPYVRWGANHPHRYWKVRGWKP